MTTQSLSPNQTVSPSASPLISLKDLDITTDARAPHATMNNAPYLYGDPTYADFFPLNQTFMGDATDDDQGMETGTPWLRRAAPYLIPAATAAGGYAVGRITGRKKGYRQGVAAGREFSSLGQINAIGNAPKIDGSAIIPFITTSGALVANSPVQLRMGFPAISLRHGLLEMASKTPFAQEVSVGTYASGTFTVQFTGETAFRYYTSVNVRIGVPKLTGTSGILANIKMQLPLVNGTVLSLAATPIQVTLGASLYANIQVFPYILIQSVPKLVLGQYDTSHPIIITVEGLSSDSTVNGYVHGSGSPVTEALVASIVDARM